MLAAESAWRGLDKLEVNPARLEQDLRQSPEVVAEAVQTVMRRYGIEDAYEQLKALTEVVLSRADRMRDFIGGLDIPEEARPGSPR